MKVLIIQRVLTKYRYDLLKELAPYVDELGFVTSQGEKSGTLKVYIPEKNTYPNIRLYKLYSLRLRLKGNSRRTCVFFYPQVSKIIRNYDIIVLEGTTNLLNNFYIVPLARALKKKIVWWDAGYSGNLRTVKRKVIDNIVKPLIQMTDVQFAYSTKALKYMKTYMGAKNCFLLLNTINTGYFFKIKDQVIKNLRSYSFNPNKVKLLYVGAVEERKKIKELIDILEVANKVYKKNYYLTIVGDGYFLPFLKRYVKEKRIDEFIRFVGAIYDKEVLKNYYFNSDLFVLPGDGGLGILQALLYGLPAVCVSADGTEEDYLSKDFILKDLKEILNLDIIKLREKFDYIAILNKADHRRFIENFLKFVGE
ncbi:glycosyltransferase [Desulfurobacterium crinifex]